MKHKTYQNKEFQNIYNFYMSQRRSSQRKNKTPRNAIHALYDVACLEYFQKTPHCAPLQKWWDLIKKLDV